MQEALQVGKTYMYMILKHHKSQVNPYEVENVADTLNRALEMPLVIIKYFNHNKNILIF